MFIVSNLDVLKAFESLGRRQWLPSLFASFQGGNTRACVIADLLITNSHWFYFENK